MANSSSATVSVDDTRGIEWNEALEELLCDEAEKCAGLAWLHGHSEVYYQQKNNFLQIPIIVLSTVTGAASVGSGSLFPGNAGTASVILGGVSILVSILGTLNSHYAFAKKAEGHKIGHVQYSQIHRTIHIEMSLPRSQRMAPKQVLRYIKDDLKRLMETIPRVPDEIIAKYKKEIIPASGSVSHPDITNGIHRVEMYAPRLSGALESLTPHSPKPLKITLNQPV
jgi:hypothetical protein